MTDNTAEATKIFRTQIIQETMNKIRLISTILIAGAQRYRLVKIVSNLIFV